MKLEGELSVSMVLSNALHSLESRALSDLQTSSRPQIINDATLQISGDRSSDNPTMLYEPAKYISDMHAAPRFGHTNRIGKLASVNPKHAIDYAGGLKQFTLFVIVPFIIWAIILVLFKFLYGIDKVGCAAGGEVLDIKELSKLGLSRTKRKKRILRSWRLQTIFMITGTLIPTTSLIMMQSGWKKVQLAWEEIKLVVDDVESLAFRGWNVLDGLQKSKQALEQNRLVQDVLQQTPSGEPLFTSWCPNSKGEDDRLAFLEQAMNSLEYSTKSLVTLFDQYVPKSTNGFIAVTQATQSVDRSIQWFFDHDWIWKMYIMIVNVLNVFMVLCCYIFSKHNIIHPPTKYYLTFWIVPLFCIATGLLLMVTASSGVATLMNSDFCAGGEGLGSPQGTIRDAILSFQYGTLDIKNNQTGTMGIVSDTFNYYAEGCLTDHPLAFLEDYAGRVDEATARIVELTQNLPDTNSTLDILSQECGGDMSFMPNTLEELENELLLVQSNMNKLVSLASCYSISPLLRRLTHGAVCKESPQGLTWIWGSSLFISICCFVMLTTRAALYNSIKSRKPRDKKSKRAVEKEFEEYKEFMSEYYEDVAEWKLEHSCKKSSILEIDFGSQILLNPTFETASTTKASSDEDAFSQEAEINRSIGPDESTETEPDPLQRIGDNDDKSSSSYDSDYESDSDLSDDSGSDDESALLSFLVETKSILSETKTIISDAKSMASSMVNQTMHKIRNLRPLLVKSKDEDADSDDEQLNGDRGFIFDHDHSPAKSLKIPETGDGLWNKFLTPPSRSGLLGLKTPTAPLKPFSFLGRTSDAAAHELASLTRTPSRDEIRPNHNNRVHPRRLTLSPLIDPIPLEKLHRPQRRPKQKSRLNLGMPTPERPSQTIRRPRFDSNGSDDMSLYVEDAPRPPENVYRRLQRTTDDEQKNRQRVNGNCSSSKTRSSAPSQTKK